MRNSLQYMTLIIISLRLILYLISLVTHQAGRAVCFVIRNGCTELRSEAKLTKYKLYAAQVI